MDSGIRGRTEDGKVLVALEADTYCNFMTTAIVQARPLESVMRDAANDYARKEYDSLRDISSVSSQIGRTADTIADLK